MKLGLRIVRGYMYGVGLTVLAALLFEYPLPTAIAVIAIIVSGMISPPRRD